MADVDSEVISVAPDGRPTKDQPAWRKDFPLDWPEDEYRSRREFVAFLMLTSAAFVAGQFWILLIQARRKAGGQPPVREIASVNELAVGQSKLFEYPKQGNHCILVRLSDDELRRVRSKVYSPFLPRPAAARFGENALSLPRRLVRHSERRTGGWSTTASTAESRSGSA